MNFINVILCVLMLLIVPACMGYAACHGLGLPRHFPACYLFGNLSRWALMQLLSIPMTLLKTGFVPLVLAISAGSFAISACGVMLYLRERRESSNHSALKAKGGWDAADVFALAALIGLGVYWISTHLRFQHIDYDDARFVVLAVDIDNTNRLFLTDFGTGKAVADFIGTLRHDLFSPWPVYFAYIARMTATPVTAVAHTVIPFNMMLCAFSAYWLVAERFFPDRRFEKYSVVFLAMLVNLYGGHAPMAAEGYFIRRLWMGKAFVGAVGIPTLYLALTAVWEKTEGWKPYLLIYLVSLALCFVSAMGIILCSLLCGSFGLAYGIQKRRIAVALKIWGGMLICLAYVGIMMVRIL